MTNEIADVEDTLVVVLGSADDDSAGINVDLATSANVGSAAVAGLEELVAHPDNPRGPVIEDEVAELAESVRQFGVLEPLIVVSADAYADAGREVPAGGARWVIVAGHRRYAAAKVAGQARLPILIRDDLLVDGADFEVMLAENVSREDLSPLQEARGFGALRERGRSQRAIAKVIGCSQSHVSKRLALLELPAATHPYVETGVIGTGIAEQLLRLRSHPEAMVTVWEEVVEEYDVERVEAEDVEWSVTQALRRIDLDAALAKARAEAEATGLQVMTYAEFKALHPKDYWKRAFESDEEIEAARQDDAIVVVLDTAGGYDHYSTADLPTPEHVAGEDGASSGSSYTDPGSYAEVKQRRIAMKERVKVAAKLATRLPKRDVLLANFAATLIGRVDYGEVTQMAFGWLKEAGLVGDVDTAWAYTAARGDEDAKKDIQLAWAMVIAQYEVEARQTYRSWDVRTGSYVQALIDNGYEPTEWERNKLTDAGVVLREAGSKPSNPKAQ
jgi:ParB/RepB/Spo0J family partition protein